MQIGACAQTAGSSRRADRDPAAVTTDYAQSATSSRCNARSVLSWLQSWTARGSLQPEDPARRRLMRSGPDCRRTKPEGPAGILGWAGDDLRLLQHPDDLFLGKSLAFHHPPPLGRTLPRSGTKRGGQVRSTCNPINSDRFTGKRLRRIGALVMR
jgi:hypothetical protein